MSKGVNTLKRYHVGFEFPDIYAGTAKKNNREWLDRSMVTDEAIGAVLNLMISRIPAGDNKFAYAFQMRNGKYARLIVETADKCPDWAAGLFDDEGTVGHDA